MEIRNSQQTVLSTSLTRKIEKQRQAAQAELPKARLCAAVVHAVMDHDSGFELAVTDLKKGLGLNWSHVTAFQFMSGRQARLAAECGAPAEQADMLLAHQLAEAICNQIAFEKLSFTDLKALASSVKTVNTK